MNNGSRGQENVFMGSRKCSTKEEQCEMVSVVHNRLLSISRQNRVEVLRRFTINQNLPVLLDTIKEFLINETCVKKPGFNNPEDVQPFMRNER